MPNRVEILKEKFVNSYGLPFQEVLPQSLIQEVISELQIKYYRRLFDPFVTLWAFLSQVLDVDKSCDNTVSRIIAWLSPEKVELPSTDTSAYCQARQRLPEKFVQKLFIKTGSNLAYIVPESDLWCGRNVEVIDCSTVSMPDTKKNQSSYPQSGQQKAGCGFPIAKIGALFNLITGAVTQVVIDKLNTNDIIFARALYSFLKPLDVLLGDAAFCSYADFFWIIQKGCDAVVRKNNARIFNLKTIKIINRNDKLVCWHKPKSRAKGIIKEDFDSLPISLTVREISYSTNVPGFRTKQISIITTLLDTEAYPTHTLIQLYRDRWHVELNFKHLKTTLGMDILRCKTPEMIRKELYVYLLAYNLLRSLMWKAGKTYGVSPLNLSIQGTRHDLNNFISQFLCASNKCRQRIYSKFIKVIVHKSVPQRPNRVEPRVVKRRPKAYAKMSIRRELLRKKLIAA
jgi:Transposase DDE domain/Insertion element 4 transposase N-terminal